LAELAHNDYRVFMTEAAEGLPGDREDYLVWAADAAGVAVVTDTCSSDCLIEVVRPRTWISGLEALAEDALCRLDTAVLASCTRLLERFHDADAAVA
jgi:hypothetical protein